MTVTKGDASYSTTSPGGSALVNPKIIVRTAKEIV